MSVKSKLVDILDKFASKITSGRFIFTIIIALVYAYMACSEKLDPDRIHEITLIVLYAYFSRPRITPLEPPDEIEPPKEN